MASKRSHKFRSRRSYRAFESQRRRKAMLQRVAPPYEQTPLGLLGYISYVPKGENWPGQRNAHLQGANRVMTQHEIVEHNVRVNAAKAAKRERKRAERAEYRRVLAEFNMRTAKASA